MRYKIFLILQLYIGVLYGQQVISFKDPLQIIAKDKYNSEIKKGAILTASGIILYNDGDGYSPSVITKNVEGKTVYFAAKRTDNFEFKNIDNVSKVWDKFLLIKGTYESLLTNGYQYDLRNNLNLDALEYIRTLGNNDRFYNDDYFEDYLYTIINKIHPGILSDKRPGSIYVKILKDPEPNAFSLPNGCIIISTGLLSTIQSEDELVGILAYEVAHFVLDHQVINYNKEVDRKKKAEFWSSFATIVAASADAYMSVNNRNHIPGVITATTAIFSSIISDEIITRLGIKFSQSQELEADALSKEILESLQYNKWGLSAALFRIKSYCILTGNYLALSSSGSHPSLDSRITNEFVLKDFSQPSYLKKVSFINSFNAWIELWGFAHNLAASDLANRNITNGVGTESDYIIQAVVKKRISNTKESNEEVINLLNKAKSLNVTPYLLVSKEEGITYLRLDKKMEAKKAFQTYLTLLNELKDRNEIKELKNSNKAIEEELNWTKKMIFKVDSL